MVLGKLNFLFFIIGTMHFFLNPQKLTKFKLLSHNILLNKWFLFVIERIKSFFEWNGLLWKKVTIKVHNESTGFGKHYHVGFLRDTWQKPHRMTIQNCKATCTLHLTNEKVKSTLPQCFQFKPAAGKSTAYRRIFSGYQISVKNNSVAYLHMRSDLSYWF